jgi:hypothetical protein
LLGIVREFTSLSQPQIAENKPILSVYMGFAVKKLWELKTKETQSTCIKVVGEVIKAVDLEKKDLELLNFVNNLFEGPNQQKFQVFFEATLRVVKNSLIFQRQNAQEFLLANKSFGDYLKKVLSPSS